MKICPSCKGKRFIISAIVVQKWIVNECGLCIDIKDDFIDVQETAGDEDLWECYECGYRALGREFESEDELLIEER